MDTSIVILIILGVLVFALPTLVRGTDTAGKTGDAGTVPPSARDPKTNSYTNCPGRASQPGTLLQGELADLPDLGVPVASHAPHLNLKRPAPHLTVVAGGLEDAAVESEPVYLASAVGMENVPLTHRPLDTYMSAQTPKNTGKVADSHVAHTPSNRTVTQVKRNVHRPQQPTRPATSAPVQRTATTPATPKKNDTNKLKRLLSVGFLGLLAASVVTGVIAIFGPLSFATPTLTLAASLACLTGVVVLNGMNEPAHVSAPARNTQPPKQEARKPAPQTTARPKQEERTPARRVRTIDARSIREIASEAVTSEIPVVKQETAQPEQQPEQVAKPEATEATAKKAQPESPRTEVAPATEAPELHLGQKFEDLSAGKGWFPKDMPVPTYVTKATAQPVATSGRKMEASQTSYGDTPAKREELAHAFASEAGARPELEDAAQDASALRHGKAAIRSDKKVANSDARAVVDDVLARRRA